MVALGLASVTGLLERTHHSARRNYEQHLKQETFVDVYDGDDVFITIILFIVVTSPGSPHESELSWDHES